MNYLWKPPTLRQTTKTKPDGDHGEAGTMAAGKKKKGQLDQDASRLASRFVDGITCLASSYQL